MLRLDITHRAHTDLQDIHSYSIREFGVEVANQYLKDIEGALLLLQENPGLLQNSHNIAEHFRLYRVREHFLIFSLLDDCLILLTIGHVKIDLVKRLVKLEPTLLKEVEILYSKLVRK